LRYRARVPHVLPATRLDDLIAELRARGHRVKGPRLSGGALVTADVHSAADLPSGVIDEASPGRYRTTRTEAPGFFQNVVGPTSLRALVDPAQRRLFRVAKSGRALRIIPDDDSPPSVAVIGARACDVAALAISDRVHDDGAHKDRHYARARDGLFVVAVQCTTHAKTCFCTSMGTGPAVQGAFDLKLTELLEKGEHRFLVESGSAEGADVLQALALTSARDDDVAYGQALVDENARGMDPTPLDARHALLAALEHPRYDDVAQRCLACGNCTLVCPTCFCSTVEDGTDVVAGESTRTRRWDSCFTSDHSLLHGHSVRATTASRFRQWLTHKLATWHDQFDTPGCTGCGRCIAWCPVGIDLREEARAIQQSFGTDPYDGGQ
jgi:sulfhydrogenase subunit beta (sulfur reductase)